MQSTASGVQKQLILFGFTADAVTNNTPPTVFVSVIFSVIPLHQSHYPSPAVATQQVTQRTVQHDLSHLLVLI